MLRRSVSAAVVLCSSLALTPTLIAAPSPSPVSAKAKRFAKSVAVRELPSLAGIPREEKFSDDRERENEELPRASGPYRDGPKQDLALQGPVPSPNMPGPSVSFAGLSADDDAGLFGSRFAPPDTNGDVGPNHYVQTVNSMFRVYDKTGTPVTAAAKLSDLFAPLGAPCGMRNDGDPIVLYDPLADRWLISQFCIPVFLPTPAAHSHQVIAISQTADPAGVYYLYDFEMTNAKLNDYPHFGVWPDGYYMSDNQFGDGTGSNSYSGAGLFAFDRLKMLQGDPTASFIYFDYNATDPTAGGMLPTDMDGLVPPPAGTPDFFLETRSDEFGDPIDALRIYEFHADFANPASSTLTVRPDLPLAAFDQRQPSGRTDIEQPGTGEQLDSIGDRMMFRISYRTLAGGVQSLVANFTVNVSGTNPTSAATYQAGIRFVELRRNSGTGAFSVQNQATYSTDPGNGATGRNVWCGSAAQDNAGDVALGFSASSTTLNPSILWAGRLAGDPANTLAQGESTVQAGGGVQQSNTFNRWGDYSSMSVDPSDDCTFWYAQEYNANDGVFDWATRVAAFSFPGCTAAPKGTVSGQVTSCVGGAPVPGVTVTTAEGFVATTDATGHYSITMPPGNYTLSFSKAGFTGAAAGAAITNGNNTTVDLCLTGFAILGAAGTSLVAETCSPPNGALDPGEQVLVSICVQNNGGADTTDLTGTLLPGHGVAQPPAPVDFGVVAAGGAGVCKNVAFRVASLCGEPVALRVQLNDGATDLGIVEYDYITGALAVSYTEGFDGVTAPNLPSGWVAGNGPSDPAPFWVTSAAAPDSAPNAAFVDDPAVVSDKHLDSTSIPIGSPAAVLTFRHSYNLDADSNPALGYDGGVLEISIDGGAFQDIVDAGGSFTSNGYNRTISNNFASPIAGRSAWSGNSGGYVTTVVQLPAAANGKNVKLRFRMASDNSVGVTGWSVDTISVQAAYTCCSLPVPVVLSVDDVASAGSSNHNGVFEPGEQVTVAPTWMNGGSTGVLSLSGIAFNFTGPAGATYTLNDSSAAYGTIAQLASADCLTGGGGDCYQMSVDNPAVRPAPHWDATFGENANLAAPTGEPSQIWTVHIGASFADVPTSNIFYKFIETIFHNGVTGGCGAPGYCPTNPALRKQMAVFLLKSRFGSDYTPPAAVGIFGDVPASNPFAPWIEDLYNKGITGGCSTSPLKYCPDNTVLRQQMAVFLLKTLEGSSYVPPVCAGVFADVPCPSTFAAWIEDLAARGITGGCGAGNFCPTAPNTRGQMAVFLTKTFGLLLYGP
ncbi:MAG TPA: carboxypeptidase regulatory-like domain-containing protein [Thermoanaerobaculia bacterium]|nr:carboxypeptidase regulatory-like domain-containing protein [Thermoanaerobaculia bacterium]